jgi:hypothetical protein
MAIKIPFYDSKAGMTPEAAGAPMSQPAMLPMAPMENVAEAGIPGMRLAKVGDQLLTTATEITSRLGHARNVKDFAAMDLETRLRMDKLGNEIEQDPEATPETWGKRFEEGATKIKDEVRKLTGNELVQAQYEKLWATHYPVKLQEITAKGYKADAKNIGAAFEEHYPQYVELYAQATDELNRTQIKDTVEKYIGAAVKSGSITPHQGAAARVGFIPAAMKAKVVADIGTDPVMAQAKLTNYKENYPGLQDKDLLSLNATASGALHRVQENNTLEVQKLYESKQLTPDKLMGMRDGRIINMGTWKHYEAALQNDAAPMGTELNYDTWAKHHAAAMNGKLNPDDAYMALKAGQYGKGPGASAKADQLIRLNEARGQGDTPKDMSFTKDPYFRLAAREIEDRLKPLEELRRMKGMQPGAKETTPTHEAGFLFLEACKEAQNKGELTGPWMWKKAQEIIQPFELMGAKGFKPGAARTKEAPVAGPAQAGGGPDVKQRALEILRQRGRIPAQ